MSLRVTFNSKEVDIYIAVVAKDKSKQSDSQYLREIIILSSNPKETPFSEEKDHTIHLPIESDHTESSDTLNDKLPEQLMKYHQNKQI